MKPDNLKLHSNRAVPQGSVNRMLNMGSLGVSIASGAISEAVKQSIVGFKSELGSE